MGGFLSRSGATPSHPASQFVSQGGAPSDPTRGCPTPAGVNLVEPIGKWEFHGGFDEQIWGYIYMYKYIYIMGFKL